MREAVKQYSGQRIKIKAKYEYHSINNKNIMLFRDVKINNEQITDHAWILEVESIKDMELKGGKYYKFIVEVYEYTKYIKEQQVIDYGFEIIKAI